MKRYAIIKNIHSNNGIVTRLWLGHFTSNRQTWGCANNKHLYVSLDTAYKRLNALKRMNNDIHITLQILDYDINNNDYEK